MTPRVRNQRGNQFRKRIGANDARHREYLVAPARQLTSSASLKCKGCRKFDSAWSESPRRASAPCSVRRIFEPNESWDCNRDCNLECGRFSKCGLVRSTFVRCVRERCE